MVVLDTCAIIELCKKTPTFSANTFKKMDAGAYLLSISFAEIACKVKLKKLEMNTSPEELFREFKLITTIQIIDIGAEHWLDSINLEWHENKDPADRLITAFAKKNQLPIITSDQKIKQFYKNVLW